MTQDAAVNPVGHRWRTRFVDVVWWLGRRRSDRAPVPSKINPREPGLLIAC